MPTMVPEQKNMSESMTRVLADNSRELPTRMQILRAGKFNTSKYGVMDVGMADLHEMARHFSEGVGLNGDGAEGAPINFEHKFSHAAAWIKGLVVEGDALYADPIEWTSAGEEAVKGGLYKFISSEFALRSLGQLWQDPENTDITATNVLDGAGLTNYPLFRGQNSIFASREDGNGGIYINASKDKESSMTLEEVKAKEVSALTQEEKTFLAEHKADLSTEELTKFGLEAAPVAGEEDKNKKEPVVPEAVKTPELEATAVTASLEKAGLVAVKADRLAALEDTHKQYQTEKAEQIVDAHIARGALKADKRDPMVERLVNASKEQRTELEGFMDDLASNPVMASTQGSDRNAGQVSSIEELRNKAGEIVKASRESGGTPVDPVAALTQARAENPELAKSADAEIRGEAK